MGAQARWQRHEVSVASDSQITAPDQPALILELFRALPPSGSEWSVEGRQVWLRCAAAIIELIYDRDGNEPPILISISLPSDEQQP
jgi:hypothetical protein